MPSLPEDNAKIIPRSELDKLSSSVLQPNVATPNLTYAADTHTPWQLGVDVLERPLPIVDGAVLPPDAPGLGISLDRDALARMHEDYERCGIRHAEDD